MHEVHRPRLVDTFWHGQRLWLVTHQAFSRLATQVELQLFLDAVDTLAVPSKAPDLAQILVTQAKDPVAVVVGQTQPPVGHFDVLCVLRALVATV